MKSRASCVFITYKVTTQLRFSFVFSSWILNEFYKYMYMYMNTYMYTYTYMDTYMDKDKDM